jgi:hypothetical protein
MLRALVDAGWDFNQVANGVPLAAGFHGNHPGYTIYVSRQIDGWLAGRSATPADFRVWVEATLLPHLRAKIAEARLNQTRTGESLNDYFGRL